MATCKNSDHCVQNRFPEKGNVKSGYDIMPESANILTDLFHTTPYYSLYDLLTTHKKINIVGKYILTGLYSNQIFRLLKSGINLLYKKSSLINLNDLSTIIDDKPAAFKGINTSNPIELLLYRSNSAFSSV